MRINYSLDGLEDIHKQLIRANDFQDAPTSYVYLQITRGAAPRTHYFPQEDVEPTVYAFAQTWERPSAERWAQGFSAMTVPDRRWSRVDIKTICLLPNVLAFQDAIEAGADDAVLVRDGVAIEGAHMNFWGVFDGTVVTHPATSNILSGITREVVLELADQAGIALEERPIQVEELKSADELFFTGTTGEVRPLTSLNGAVIGDGSVGPVTQRLSDLFHGKVQEVQSGLEGSIA
jgi:D-alanine transaminase